MKTERRHELQTNYLASLLTVWIEKIKPYSTSIILAVGIAIVASIIISYFNKSKHQEEEAAWNEFTYAMTSLNLQVDSLDIQAQEHAGTSMEPWAILTWADYQLSNASDKYLLNRNETRQTIKKIRELYEALIAEANSDEIQNRAQLGLARTLELSNDIEQARKAYQKVDGLFAGVAKSRLEELNRPGISDTFTWLASAKASMPAAPTGPGIPGKRPLFDTGFDPIPPGGRIESPTQGEEQIDFLKMLEEATKNVESSNTVPDDETGKESEPAESSGMMDNGTTEEPSTEPPIEDPPAVEPPISDPPVDDLPSTEPPKTDSEEDNPPGNDTKADDLLRMAFDFSR